MSVDEAVEQDGACTQAPELLHSSQGQHSFQRGHLSSHHSLNQGKRKKRKERKGLQKEEELSDFSFLTSKRLENRRGLKRGFSERICG